MIEFAEILPYLFMLFGFVTMVLVARYLTNVDLISITLLSFSFVSMYRREMFVEDRTTVSISQSARSIPVDRIESPYRLNIQEEGRSTLKGKDQMMGEVKRRFV